MRKYDSYKESKIDAFGDIPIDWKVIRMKHLVDSSKYYQIGDGDHGSIKPEMYQFDSGIPYIRVQNLTWNGKLDFNGMVYISDEVQEKNLKSKLIPNDILIAKTGATIGKLAIIPDEIEQANTTSSVGKITVNQSRFNSKYVLYSMMSRQFTDQIWIEASQKSAQPGFNVDDLVLFQLVIPKSLEEQTAIANYLDRKTAEIDELIADKKRLLELYEEEKTAIINQAVTKGINPDAPMKDSGIEWLGEIPEHWETVSLKWVSKIYSGGTPSKNNEDFWQNGTIPWLNSGTVNQFFITEPSEFITEEALNSSSAKWIPEHSIVIALAGQGKTKGMAAQVMFECTCNQSMGVIVPNDIIVNRFLLYYLTRNYQNIRNLGGGDKRDGINLEMVGGIPLPVIPLPEQAEIVRHIEDHSNLIDAKKAKTEKLIELLTEYRTALISEVVTGKIKVID